MSYKLPLSDLCKGYSSHYSVLVDENGENHLLRH